MNLESKKLDDIAAYIYDNWKIGKTELEMLMVNKEYVEQLIDEQFMVNHFCMGFCGDYKVVGRFKVLFRNDFLVYQIGQEFLGGKIKGIDKYMITYEKDGLDYVIHGAHLINSKFEVNKKEARLVRINTGKPEKYININNL